MMTHLFDDSGHTKCGNFDPADEFALPEETASCVECRFHDEAEAAWEEYAAQPTNFGVDSFLIRQAEHDAYIAAYIRASSKAVPF